MTTRLTMCLKLCDAADSINWSYVLAVTELDQRAQKESFSQLKLNKTNGHTRAIVGGPAMVRPVFMENDPL